MSSNNSKDNNNKDNNKDHKHRSRRGGDKTSPKSNNEQPKVSSPSKVLNKNDNHKFELKETRLFSKDVNNNNVDNKTTKPQIINKSPPSTIIKQQQPIVTQSIQPLTSNIQQPSMTTLPPSTSENLSNSSNSNTNNNENHTDCIKIINKTLKVNKVGVESLQKLLKDNDNFMVVGAVGAQSSGKSSILSALALKSNNSNSSSNSLPFEVQSESNFCLGNHQTDGIDVYIDSRDRIIYIDTQPLDSISILCELIDKSVHIPSNIVSYEHYHHLQSLRIVMFLMSICHVLLIVQENKSLDLSMCKIIRTSMMLKNKLPDISQPNLNPSQLTNSLLEGDQFEYKSKLICVFNKLNEIDYDMKPLDKTMSYLFTNPKDNYLIHPSSTSNSNNNNSNNILSNIECFQIPERKLAPPNVSIKLDSSNTPTVTASSSTNSSPTLQQQQQISNLQILNSIPLLSPYKYYPMFNEAIDKLKHQIILLKSTSKFNKVIKETEWLDNSLKIWDSIQNSDILESYSKQIKSLYSIGLSK